MENVNVISKRCSVLIKDNVFSLVVLPTDNKKKTNLLFLWLLAWSVSGVIIIANYFKLNSANEKLMILIWLAFWAYFEFKVIRVFMWKRFGKEKLWIKNGVVHYQQEISGRGKIQNYDANLVTEFVLIPVEKENFMDVINQSFWVKGGERLLFIFQGKYIKMGMQLTDEEANQSIKAINKFLKKN